LYTRNFIPRHRIIWSLILRFRKEEILNEHQISLLEKQETSISIEDFLLQGSLAGAFFNAKIKR